MNNDRFKAALPEHLWEGQRVLIVGAGGIGSYTAPLIARMGARSIGLVDFDIVCSENVATQDVRDVEAERETHKVYAVGDRIREIAPHVDVRTWPDAFSLYHLEEYNPTVVVLSVDSIEVREQIMEAVDRWSTQPGCSLELVVDPRMGFEELEVYTWKPTDTYDSEAYFGTLRERGHRELPCGAKAIAYTGAFAGSVVASVLRRHLNGVTVPWLVCGDIGAYGFLTTWRQGERYEECVVQGATQ